MKSIQTPRSILMTIIVASAAFATTPAAADPQDLDCSEYAAQLKDLLLENSEPQIYSMQQTKVEDITRALGGTLEKCTEQPPAEVRAGNGAQATIRANAVLTPSDCPSGFAIVPAGGLVRTVIRMPGVDKAFDEPNRPTDTSHVPTAEFETIFEAPVPPTGVKFGPVSFGPGDSVNVFGLSAGGPVGFIAVGPTEIIADHHAATPACNARGVCGGSGWAEVSRMIGPGELLYLRTEGKYDCIEGA